MKRMKNLWDDWHPEYSHFTDKNLRQQASYIQKRGYIRETQNKDNNDLENRNDPERPTTIIEERLITVIAIITCWKLEHHHMSKIR